jgi:hypothetical protein
MTLSRSRWGVMGHGLGLLGLLLLGPAGIALGQVHHHGAAPADSTAHHGHASPPPPREHEGHEMAGMPHADHHAGMRGMYGPYPMNREASGTAWQPDLTRHRSTHFMRGSWSLMVHGSADLVFDHQGGKRGEEKTFSGNWIMGMASRSLGPGRVGFRAMMSAEPATIGKGGYPLLLQTGETADGVRTLIDRQHPHDLFMELAGSYSLSSGSRSLFLYAGLPGEPALGPPAFMHRFSGLAFPDAPITHHWLDSSHITFGVLTVGGVTGGLKLDASAFRGREPDQDRYDIESPKLDSHAFRLSANPSPGWALQVSRGRLESPEQLEPGIDVDRTTASVLHATDWGTGHWETTFAWGRNEKRPGPSLDGFLAESAVELQGKHTLFARFERVEKDELFEEPDPRHGQPFWVGKLAGGYRYDFPGRPAVGLGVVGSLIQVPAEIRDDYGSSAGAAMLFTRIQL